MIIETLIKTNIKINLLKLHKFKKILKKSLAKNAKYDRKSGWWPQILEQQNNQHTLLSLLGENLGIAEQLSDLKAKYVVIKK